MAEVVISGISGRFPEANNVEEFWKNLTEGVDMVTIDSRRIHPNGPSRAGTIKSDLTKFDNTFFGIHAKQAERLDPGFRILHEVVFEAIMDAGVNPATLRGKNVGVFIGATDSPTRAISLQSKEHTSRYDLTGSANAMAANRISYAFDFKGPSYTLDTLCSSSMLALNNGLNAIKAGHCDSAIIGTHNLLLQPGFTDQVDQSGALSAEGKCQSYDSSGDGYVRSEAIVAVFIQKKKDALRCYGTLIHSNTNSNGFNINGISSPSGASQHALITRTYKEAKINPKDVFYIEGHGTGTKAGDPEELNAMASIFLEGRTKDSLPLLVGSVKSNMGHPECASGLCSIAKVLLALENKMIPGNLHYKKPNSNIPALLNGQIKVVNRNTPIATAAVAKKRLVSLNSSGFGGSNVHVILEGPSWKAQAIKPGKKFSSNLAMSSSNRKITVIHRKGSTPNMFNPNVENGFTENAEHPELVLFSGTTEKCVAYALEKIKSSPRDLGFEALLHNIAKERIPGHNFRGFTIVGDQSQNAPTSPVNVQEMREVGKPPVWFIFSGMGTVYKGMFDDLINIKPFAESLEKCNEILMQFELDIFNIIENGDEEQINKHMGMLFAVMQTSLIDTIEALGIKPDGMIGHSAGELACAYADKCITREQAILINYYKDRTVETCPRNGAMAAVGLTMEQVIAECPNDIYPACHNDKNSVTIAGPFESIKSYVNQLTSKGIFARLIDTGGVAYHSPYLAPILPTYEQQIKAVLEKPGVSPKERSKTWISTCVPDGLEDSSEYCVASTSYFLANIRDPVKFYDATRKIPENALVLEISSHALFVSILRKSLAPKTPKAVIGLIRKANGNNRIQFLTGIGQLYLNGIEPNLLALLQQEDKLFPVQPGTKMIAPLIQWENTNTFELMDYDFVTNKAGETTIEISLTKDEFSYVKGHKIDSRILFPASGYLELVWKKLANSLGQHFEKITVEFLNVRFENALILNQGKVAKVDVSIATKNGGQFQVSTPDGLLLVKGTIVHINQRQMTPLNPSVAKDENEIVLSAEDFYKMARLAGYEYEDIFKGIRSINENSAKLEWKGNWVSFIDTLLQTELLFSGGALDCLRIPTSIRRIMIDPAKFIQEGTDDEYLVKVESNKALQAVFCPGIQIYQMKTNAIPRKSDQIKPIVEELKFVPYFDEYDAETETAAISGANQLVKIEYAVKYFIDLVLENSTETVLRIEENTDKLSNSISKLVMNSFGYHAQRKATIVINTETGDTLTAQELSEESSSSFEITINVLSIGKVQPSNKAAAYLMITNSVNYLEALDWQDVADRPEFVIYHIEELDDTRVPKGYISVAQKYWTNKFITLYKKKCELKKDPILIHMSNNEFTWINQLKVALAKSTAESTQGITLEDQARIYLICSGENYSGLLGFMNCLRLESGAHIIRCITSPTKIKPTGQEGFLNSSGTSSSSVFSRIFQQDLLMNCLNEFGQIGSYRHFPLQSGSSRMVQTKYVYVNCETKGDLSSLKFYESCPSIFTAAIARTESKSKVCDVYYAALNFRDIMLATGKLPQEAIPGKFKNPEHCLLGLEFSGVLNHNGERVMGIVENKGLATHLIAEDKFTWNVPNDWTLEQAATVPVAYATAYYALIIRGNMQPGQSILIHSGSGGVGQAAIAIAFNMNCKVFTSIGTNEKKEFLLKRFPQLQAENILHSRDLTFEEEILTLTNGVGVDFILNSLAEEKLHASVRCLAQNGKFLEIGKYDLSKNHNLGMEIFLKNITFHGILLDAILDPEGNPFLEAEASALHELMIKGIEQGIVKPLPSTVYQYNELEKAFRFMANGKHVGKIMIQMKQQENTNGLSLSQHIEAVSMTYFDAKKSYIIIGGLGGLGFELGKWMIERGCKILILVSRTPVKNAYQHCIIKRWRNSGITVNVDQADLSTIEGTRQLIQTATNAGQVGGIFNLAMVLKDRTFKNQTEEAFIEVLKPKYNATVNLDIISRELCPQLDHFVVFSSYSAGRGIRGQTNYGFANSTMERICEHRRKECLPGLAIQWGALGDVGIVYEKMGGNETNLYGLCPQRIVSCFNVLDYFLRHQLELSPVVTSWTKIVKVKKPRNLGRRQSSAKQNYPEIFKTLMVIMGLNEPPTNRKLRLVEQGLDSLMAVEAKQAIESYFNNSFTVEQIREFTWEKLSEMSLETNK